MPYTDGSINHPFRGVSMSQTMRHIAIVLTACTATACLAQEPTAVKDPKAQAWSALYAGLSDGSLEKRTTAVQVLGLLPDDPKAEEAALNALKDDKRSEERRVGKECRS